MAGRLPTQFSGMIGPDGRTIIIPIAEGLRLSTDGTASLALIDVSDESLARLGPYVSEVQAFTTTEGKTTNMQWKVQFRSSTSGRSFNTAVDLFSFITTNSEGLQAAYSTTNQFGLKMRWFLACQPTTGTAVESASVWCYLAFRLRN